MRVARPDPVCMRLCHPMPSFGGVNRGTQRSRKHTRLQPLVEESFDGEVLIPSVGQPLANLRSDHACNQERSDDRENPARE